MRRPGNMNILHYEGVNTHNECYCIALISREPLCNKACAAHRIDINIASNLANGPQVFES
jgi:hypothetical protein